MICLYKCWSYVWYVNATSFSSKGQTLLSGYLHWFFYFLKYLVQGKPSLLLLYNWNWGFLLTITFWVGLMDFTQWYSPRSFLNLSIRVPFSRCSFFNLSGFSLWCSTTSAWRVTERGLHQLQFELVPFTTLLILLNYVAWRSFKKTQQ